MPNSAAAQLSLLFPAMPQPLDLTDAERAELVRALRGLIDSDRFPLSARIRRLNAIVNKLDPPKASTSEPFPAPKPPAEPSYARRRRR